MTALAFIPAIARNSTFVLTPQTVNASTGVLSNGTISGVSSFSITGVIQNYKPFLANKSEEISPSTSGPDNNVQIGTTWGVSLGGFFLANDSASAPTNIVDAIFAGGFYYVKLVVVMAGKTETYFGAVDRLEKEFSGKGKIGFSLDLLPVDIGAANPVYS